MAKVKTQYVCTDCGADAAKWQGQCPGCGAWNTMKEFRAAKSSGSSTSRRAGGYAGTAPEITTLDAVDLAVQPRFSSGIGEFDRVLGGGLVPGSAILIGGHPGAGKSTLLLQAVCHLATQMPVLYVTGEESLQQVAMRASRLGVADRPVKMLSETDVDSIIHVAETEKPRILVVDSIQVMHLEGLESAPGSVSQVRESAAVLTRYAKQSGTVLFLVGHVTKDGSLAGPKVLEHMIDCSILLEGSNDSRFRTLRGIKNRFGAVNELGVFAMVEHGLKEVKNPSAIFLNQSREQMAGSVVTVLWEGTRPLLVELQALVDQTQTGYPKRVAIGLDQNRLAMQLAVLHRHGGIFCGDQDVFVNVVGGVKAYETGADLATLVAVLSSFKDRPLSSELVVFGEVGLSGEIRPVPSGQERIYEAAKHGFKLAVVPKANVPRKPIEGMQVMGIDRLDQALEQVFTD
jgi:DNA repair protein RadA/Sms